MFPIFERHGIVLPFCLCIQSFSHWHFDLWQKKSPGETHRHGTGDERRSAWINCKCLKSEQITREFLGDWRSPSHAWLLFCVNFYRSSCSALQDLVVVLPMVDQEVRNKSGHRSSILKHLKMLGMTWFPACQRILLSYPIRPTPAAQVASIGSLIPPRVSTLKVQQKQSRTVLFRPFFFFFRERFWIWDWDGWMDGWMDGCDLLVNCWAWMYCWLNRKIN